ncbi:MAG TPA: hypothetical protein VFG14_15015 [Chthoniobacteraceae bacterium]|nr:hypothetical protein [Chthoniobacteraceae bacterium]
MPRDERQFPPDESEYRAVASGFSGIETGFCRAESKFRGIAGGFSVAASGSWSVSGYFTRLRTDALIAGVISSRRTRILLMLVVSSCLASRKLGAKAFPLFLQA